MTLAGVMREARRANPTEVAAAPPLADPRFALIKPHFSYPRSEVTQPRHLLFIVCARFVVQRRLAIGLCHAILFPYRVSFLGMCVFDGFVTWEKWTI